MTPRTQQRHTHASAPPAHGASRRTVGLVWEWEDDPDQRVGVMRYAISAHWILRPHIFARRIEPDGTIVPVRTGTVPDGIISQLSPYEAALPMVRELVMSGVPLVEMSGAVPDFNVPHVLHDRYAEGVLAAQHFLERGIRTLVYVCEASRRYREGFADEAAKAGVSVIVPQIATTASTPLDKPGELYAVVLENLLSVHRPPLGVFVPFFSECETVLDGCLDHKLLVPEQIALITVACPHSEVECLPVPITTVVSDVEKQAFTAAALLDRMMRGDRDVPAQTLIPPRGIVARASTQITGIADPGTARAVNYILSHLHDATVSLKGIARVARVPLWRLCEEFPKHAGTTVARYIQHQRIQRARHLLDTTYLTASEIAMQCGFSELRQFRDAMRRTLGATPAAYRAKHGRTA